MKSHDEFKEKLELPFELIADTEEKMCHMFGVVKNKIMYGKKVKGIERSTFLIGPDGMLCKNGAASRCPAMWTKCSRPSSPSRPEKGRLKPCVAWPLTRIAKLLRNPTQ
jgi:hypothetical protein